MPETIYKLALIQPILFHLQLSLNLNIKQASLNDYQLYFGLQSNIFSLIAVKKVCDIYDWDGKGELDLFFLGDVMYALGMNTTKKVSF